MGITNIGTSREIIDFVLNEPRILWGKGAFPLWVVRLGAAAHTPGAGRPRSGALQDSRPRPAGSGLQGPTMLLGVAAVVLVLDAAWRTVWRTV